MSQEFENYIKSCNAINNIRASAEKHEGLHEAFADSFEPVKMLLIGLFSRLSLKGKQFNIFQAATDEEISVVYGYSSTRICFFSCPSSSTMDTEGHPKGVRNRK